MPTRFPAIPRTFRCPEGYHSRNHDSERRVIQKVLIDPAIRFPGIVFQHFSKQFANLSLKYTRLFYRWKYRSLARILLRQSLNSSSPFLWFSIADSTMSCWMDSYGVFHESRQQEKLIIQEARRGTLMSNWLPATQVRAKVIDFTRLSRSRS